MISLIINRVLTMLLLMVIGFLLSKIGMFTKELGKGVSSLLVNLILPCTIFIGFQREFSAQKLEGLLISMAVAALLYALSIVLGYVLIRNGNTHDHQLSRYCVTYGNVGVVGLPIILGVFGDEGVFYYAAYVGIANLAAFIHPVFLFAPKGEKINFRKLVSPAVVACILGFAFFMLRIQLPKVLYDTVSGIGNMTTPLAMMLVGSCVAELKKGIPDNFKDILKVCAMRLLLIPIIFIAVVYPIPIDPELKLISIVAASCPTLTTSTIFALKYGHDDGYASIIFALSTVSFMLTLPVVFWIAESIIH